MEKVKIKSVKKKEWNGKTFYDIETEDGRTGSCNQPEIADKEGKEVEVELKESGKEYKGKKQYYFNLAGVASANKGKGSFAGKNWKAENRATALTCATRIMPALTAPPTSENLLLLAEKLEGWLNRA